jgi:uncharacterized protein YbjT (DUF2867 family)
MATETSVIVLGSSGAVGTQVVQSLMNSPQVAALTLLVRRPLDFQLSPRTTQVTTDVFNAKIYGPYVAGQQVAICTLGVGEPSKVSPEEFVRVDKMAVLEFAGECKRKGVRHFELLSAVTADASSASLYARTKGELENELRALKFERLSLFHPSMILTPDNRYGLGQGAMLKIWPHLNPLLLGSWEKFRGIRVEALGRAMARNVFSTGTGAETLTWKEMHALQESKPTV